MKSYVALARPFTLLPPLLGIISGAVCAWGSAHNPDPLRALSASVILTIALGSACAALLNAANNTLNQIYDLEIDRINKPKRPLPAGDLTLRQAWVFTWIMFAIGLLPTWLVVPYPFTTWSAKFFAPVAQHECFFIYFAAFISTFVYSVPAFGRTKAHPAGWTMVARATTLEPWFIGSIFMLFLLGAASTKDFSDMKGDAAGGVRTLPIVLGVRRAAYTIAPFFFVPWLLMPIGAWSGILTGNHIALIVLGVLLPLWGTYTLWLIVRNPDELTATENHPSWRHMYLMMMAAQIGFAVAYVI